MNTADRLGIRSNLNAAHRYITNADPNGDDPNLMELLDKIDEAIKLSQLLPRHPSTIHGTNEVET